MNTPKLRPDLFLYLKFFLIFFFPVTLLICCVTFALYYSENKNDKLITETREKYTLSLLKQVIANDLQTVLSDLMILAAKNELQAMLIRTSGAAAQRKALAHEYLHYAARKKMYDQIRFLDSAGMERVRINFNNGTPLIVPDNQFQSKSQRYYFKDTFQLKRGEVFISPFDLNIEHGSIEYPLKPMIRFGTPVFDFARRKRGIVIVNYRGATIIRKLERNFVNSPGTLILLNSDGYWLKGPVAEDEWGFMYEHKKNKTFGKAFPEAWQRIAAQREGTFYTSDGLFTFATVTPLLISHQFSVVSSKVDDSIPFKPYNMARSWKIVSHIESPILNAISQKALNKLIIINSIFIPLLAFFSLLLARAIVKRKATEESLTDERNLLRTLIDAVPDYINVKDLSGRFIIVNKAIIKFFGWMSADTPGDTSLLGKTAADVYPPETVKLHEIEDHAVIKSGHPLINREETFSDKASGDVRQVATSKIPLKNNSGEIRGLLEFTRDITERKQAEKKLRQAKKEAQAANRAKSEFLANMSHEIRTPMNAVLGFTEILNDLITDPLQKNYLKSIESGGQTLMTLLNDILDLSKIEAGKMDIDAEPFSLVTALQEISRIFNNKITEKGLIWDVKIASDFPHSIVLDEMRIRQVLFNLIGNAVKFTDSGTISLSAHAVIADHDPNQCMIVLAVTDTGNGIADDQKALIFESFRQQDGHSTRQYNGAGLGLAISKRLVEVMGGAITLESEQGKGSRFEIVFPDVTIEFGEAAGHIRNIPKKSEDGTQLNFESATLLIVDDVKTNRMVLKAFLRKTAISIIEAENGQEALRMAQLHLPDLILLDIRMDEMDGYEVLERLKTDANLKTVPVIAFTAADTKQEREKIRDHGFDGYLHKPVKQTELLRKIARYLPYTAIEETGGKSSLVAEKTVVTAERSAEVPAEITPEVMTLLNGELTEFWKIVRRSGSFDKIEEFANRVGSFGQKYKLDRFSQFGNDLTIQVHAFEVDRIEASLDLFPQLVSNLNS
ncbi:response regulator [Desulfococcaceae bacterium HSG9]|nr:response regulator [Desulfococcaceae bacterium HSG9]